MCGVYYVDDDTAKEINRIVKTTEDKIKRATREADLQLQAKDIRPTDRAPILIAGKDGICYEWLNWGFQGGRQPEIKGGTLIFNARSETALERPMFKESVLHRRAVIPASGFYRLTEKGKRFVILTTQANASMELVHDRMPLILEEDEMKDWLYQDDKTEEFLHKIPCQLECRTEYRQLGLFDS